MLRGKPVVEIDICNSQPLLLAAITDDRDPDAELYRSTVANGQFYELLRSRWFEMHEGFPAPVSREKFKEQVFAQVLYGPPCTQFPLWRVFESLFPSLAARLLSEKQKAKAALPVTMQRIEADIVVRTVVPMLREMYPNVPVLTVHDSILCPESIVDACSVVLSETVRQKVGLQPRLRIKTKPN